MPRREISPPLRYDAIVVGGGPAGAATAIAIRQRELSVALIERTAREPTVEGSSAGAIEPRPSPGESVSAAAQYALRELGIWDAFRTGAHRPSHLTQSAWGTSQLSVRHAIEHELGPDFHVERELFDAWLRGRAAAAGADVFVGHPPQSVEWNGERKLFSLVCSTPEAPVALRFEAPHLIDATGRSAWLTRRLGGTRRRSDDLVCAGRTYDSASFEPSILVESAPRGWWYSAPLPGRRALALHFLGAKDALGARREDGWQRALSQAPHSAQRLGSSTSAGPIWICSATPVLSTWQSEIPFLPVGDAAVAFDPVAGTGLCFAFRSALEAASVLQEWSSGGANLFAGYQAGVRNVFEAHLRQRSELYRHERRWPAETFWRGLHGAL